jgi:hypothetical protein
MMLKTFLVDNGYIPAGFWSDEKEENMERLFTKNQKK